MEKEKKKKGRGREREMERERIFFLNAHTNRNIKISDDNLHMMCNLTRPASLS